MTSIKKPKQATAKPKAQPSTTGSEYDDSSAVTALIATAAHPLSATIQAVRRTILAADPAITEGIKWNSPSFYCSGWFATIGCRKLTRLDVVLHQGAKVRADSTISATIEDPMRILTWPSKDRATLFFAGEADFHAKRKAFLSIIQQWTTHQKSHANTA